MFIGRYGYFLNQIKLNKFYQFLVLSGRFVLPPSARKKKKMEKEKEKEKTQIKTKSTKNYSRYISY